MAIDRALDLGGIDVFAAADDHVLHPVLDVDIAVRVHIGGVAGADPAIGGQRVRGRFGQVPVAEHVVGRAGDDLSHLAARQLRAILTNDLDLHPRQRLARRTHPRAAPHIMVFGRQDRDGAGGLGHPVALHEPGVGDRLDRLAQQFERDRCGPVHHVFQARKVAVFCLGMLDHHLQRDRHDEKARDPLLDPGQATLGRELGLDNAAHPRAQRHDSQAGPADVGARHAHQDSLVLVPGRPR